MTRGRAGLLMFAVFAIGGICGAATATAWLRTHGRGMGPRGERRLEEVAVHRISRRLDLDKEQRRVLERIAEETRGRMDDYRDDAMRRVDEIMSQAYDEIMPILRGDQQAKLTQMRAETRRNIHERHRGHSTREHSPSRRRGRGPGPGPDDSGPKNP